MCEVGPFDFAGPPRCLIPTQRLADQRRDDRKEIRARVEIGLFLLSHQGAERADCPSPGIDRHTNKTPVVALASDGVPGDNLGLVVPVVRLPDGSYLLTWLITDAAGNVGNTSGETPVNVDRQPPPVELTLNRGSDTGQPGDNLTAAEPVVIKLVTERGSTVVLKGNGTEFARFVAQTEVLFHEITDIPEGEQRVTAEVTDAAGNTGVVASTAPPNTAAAAIITTVAAASGSSQVSTVLPALM